MITDKIRQLQQLQSEAQKLQIQIDAERSGELKDLPATYGFDSMDEFIQALKKAAGAPKQRRATTKSAPAAPRNGGRGKRRRAKITPEIKAQVRELAKDGKTGAAIAKAVGISLPSVQNIKKELGLVKARA